MSFNKFVARNKIGQGKRKKYEDDPGWDPKKDGNKRGSMPRKNPRADYVRNLRNMRRQGGRFGSGEPGNLGPYSPRIDSMKPGKGPYGRKDPRRIV